jgi:LuxR family quorum sensing-dependent transcriptional regulator
MPAMSVKHRPRTSDWRRKLDDTYCVLEGIRESRSPSDISAWVLTYAARFGASSLLAGLIPLPNLSRSEQLSHVLLDAWPQDWTGRYFSNGYIYHDPTIKLVRHASRPFRWSEICDLCRVCSFERRIMHEATEFGLREGVTVAFSTLERRPVGFSIAGEKLDPDPSEQSALHLVVAYAFGCASLILGTHQKTVHLSPRQRDVLQWASEGLGVNDIAERLNISCNTADTHLRAVRQRLGVSSTTHAVAEGFRLRLIS